MKEVMKELLFEIGTEEIPAGFIQPAISHLKKAMAAKLKNRQLDYGSITTAATPRRLTIAVSQLAAHQPDRQEEVTGPSTKAAFDQDNNPTPAALGFARSRGVEVKDLQVIDTPKGEYLMVVKDIPGKNTKKLLPDLLLELIRELPFPKSMRWGNGTMTFVRPIQWLLACYDNQVIDFSLDDVKTGEKTRGHRFMAPATFVVHSYDEYIEKLKKNSVIADIAERKERVLQEVQEAVRKNVQEKNAHPVLDSALVDTVTNLVEIPWGVCGSFSRKFLELPDDVLITSMREHQKYFPVVDGNDTLLPKFVAVNNTCIEDQKMAVNGHERVLRARLEDALFFFREDKKKTLADRSDDLDGIIFQNKLGTMREKSERIAGLCKLLARDLAPETEADCLRAARLAKIDLLTEMVGEFPSLQGSMGREYALRDGENGKVALAIYEHYLPVRSGSALPQSITGAIVGLADRIDTIAGCFAIGRKPTGTTDPFGLRRLALATIHIIEGKKFNLSLRKYVQAALKQYEETIALPVGTTENILDFIRRRFENDLIAGGLDSQPVAAATCVHFDDIHDCQLRIDALITICRQDNFKVLAASYKRIRNIIKENNSTEVNPELFEEEAEKLLHETFITVQEHMVPLLKQKEYHQALEIMLQIKEPVDSFFDEVMVMADDPQQRQNRLNLLTALGKLILQVGDISKMHAD